MSNINIHNYEAYLLDYYEQQLSAELTAELVLFAELHPELNIDLEDTELEYLTPEKVEFTNKDYLSKIERIEYLVIAQTENVITPSESSELLQFKQQFPEVENLIVAYQKSILPNEVIVFPNKENIRKNKTIPMYYWGSLAAACLIGFIFLWTSNNKEYETLYQSGAKINSTKKIEKYNLPDFAQLQIDSGIQNQNSNKEEDILVPVNKKIKSDNFDKVQQHDNNLVVEVNKQKDDLEIKDSSFIIQPKIKDIEFKTNPLDMPIAKDVNFKDTLENILEKEENLAFDETVKTSKPLTVKEFLRVKTKQIIMKEENPTTEKVNGDALLTSITNSIDAKTNLDLAFEATVEEDKITKHFKIGKFEYYKSSSK